MEAVKTMIRHSKTETSEVPRTLTDISMLVADVLLEAGYLLGCAGQYPESEKCFKAILALDSRCIGGWLGLGNVL
nr:hypothetical protein [bacterium]